ncbi:MAG: hypothetical protein AB200_01480 [Parcubacteria bacterium C7867-005]|nr:MAG: hypothetical protein AB200_01480 [Parcubacteria bacterium C7867-005]
MNIRRTFGFFISVRFSLLSLFLVSIFALPHGFIIAQQDACTTNTVGKTKQQLQADLEACEREIAQWTGILNSTKEESASFSRDVAALTAKINLAQTNIKAKNVAIASLGKNINEKEIKINQLDKKIEDGRGSLGELLRKTSQIDSYSIAEAMLSNKNLSEFFIDVDTYAATQRSLAVVFEELRGNKTQTQAEKEALAKQREAEADARAVIEANKKQVEISQAEKKTLLAQSQSKEVTYGQVLADRKAKAAKIKAALFPLRDVDTAIQFGTALQYAEEASKITGVRPAFLLGIFTQESGKDESGTFGKNVGTCVITNLATGETKSTVSGRVFSNGIHPTRDLPILQDIVDDLGRDPLSTKVSCPLSYGYGGAMGPAQFIPSTWKLFVDKIKSATGTKIPDPWNARDAFFASSIYLADLGAGAGTPTAERTAACRYYSGKNCYGVGGAPNVGLGYGNSVLSHASTIQTTMIDPLQDL